MFKRGRGVVGDLDTSRKPIEDPVTSQHRVALRRDQHARLRVAKYIVLLENTL